jgi:hypothetical protein
MSHGAPFQQHASRDDPCKCHWEQETEDKMHQLHSLEPSFRLLGLDVPTVAGQNGDSTLS